MLLVEGLGATGLGLREQGLGFRALLDSIMGMQGREH